MAAYFRASIVHTSGGKGDAETSRREARLICRDGYGLVVERAQTGETRNGPNSHGLRRVLKKFLDQIPG